MLNDDGELVAIIGNTRDISEQHRIQGRLEEAEQLANLGLWEYDVRSGELDWNERAARLHGFDPGDEVTFDRMAAQVHDEDRGRLLDLVGTLVDEPESQAVKYRVETDDGHRELRGRVRGEMGPEGSVAVLYGVVMEVP